MNWDGCSTPLQTGSDERSITPLGDGNIHIRLWAKMEMHVVGTCGYGRSVRSHE